MLATRPPPAPAGNARVVSDAREQEKRRNRRTDHAVCGPFFLVFRHRSSPQSGGSLRCGMFATGSCLSSSVSSVTLWFVSSSRLSPEFPTADVFRLLPIHPDRYQIKSSGKRRSHQPISLLAMVKVLLNGTVLAECDSPVILEGNYYFPPDAVRKANLTSSNTS